MKFVGRVGRSPRNNILDFGGYPGTKIFKRILYYLRRRLASGEGIVSLGVTQCVCPPSISLDGEGNVLYPVLSSLLLRFL